MVKPVLKFAFTVLVTAVLFVMAAVLPSLDLADRSPLSPLQPAAVWAQDSGRVAQLWQQVYERIPELPLENQYVSVTTGEVAASNTLASRLIQYHIYVRSRPPIYRLDWKLTLADYLGANEELLEATYPGADTLQPNPMAGDVAAIGRLNRVQRDELVAVLVSVFNTNQDSNSSSTPQPATPSTSGGAVVAPQPGAAQLLLP